MPARSWPHWTKLYPFSDRPDVGIRVLVFPVPSGTPSVPYPNVFYLREWDRLNDDEEPTLGFHYETREYYRGPLPINPPGKVCGTPEQWAGGCLYSVWIAGGYSCDCPLPEFEVPVESLSCDDGSIYVSAPAGTVVIHINVGHPFNWTAPHTFTTDNTATPTVTLKTLAGQTAPWLRVLDQDGGQLANVAPAFEAGESPYLQLRNAAGDGYCTLWSGGAAIRHADEGSKLDFTLGPQAVWLFSNPLWFNTPGMCAIGGKLAVGMKMRTVFPPTLDSQLFVDCTDADEPFAIQVRGDMGSGPDDAFKVSKDGRVLIGGSFSKGLPADIINRQLDVRVKPGWRGLTLIGSQSASATDPWLDIEDGVLDTLFRIDAAGELWTNQTSSGSTLGTVVGKMAIHNAVGELVGYLPIYDDIT